MCVHACWYIHSYMCEGGKERKLRFTINLQSQQLQLWPWWSWHLWERLHWWHTNPRSPAEMKNYDGKPHCLHCTKTRACFELPQGYEKWFNAKPQRQSAPVTDYYFTQDDLNAIQSILTKHAAQGREIGAGLKFTEYKLDNIENMPQLYRTTSKTCHNCTGVDLTIMMNESQQLTSSNTTLTRASMQVYK